MATLCEERPNPERRDSSNFNSRVNIVSLGVIDTTRDTSWYPKGIGENIQRKGTVADVAAACAFLASDDAAYVTGQTLHVSGGQRGL